MSYCSAKTHVLLLHQPVHVWFICKRTCATPIAYCELTEDEDEEATNGITLAPSQGTGTDIAQLPVNGMVGMKLWCELV